LVLLADFFLLGGGLFGVYAGAAVAGRVAGGLVLAALGALVLAEGLAPLHALPALLDLLLLTFVFFHETSSGVDTHTSARTMPLTRYACQTA
jgi:hypothetical protein